MFSILNALRVLQKLADDFINGANGRSLECDWKAFFVNDKTWLLGHSFI